MMGRLNSGIIGLGMLLVRGWIRVPNPPAMMTAFIVRYSLGMEINIKSPFGKEGFRGISTEELQRQIPPGPPFLRGDYNPALALWDFLAKTLVISCFNSERSLDLTT